MEAEVVEIAKTAQKGRCVAEMQVQFVNGIWEIECVTEIERRGRCYERHTVLELEIHPVTGEVVSETSDVGISEC